MRERWNMYYPWKLHCSCVDWQVVPIRYCTGKEGERIALFNDGGAEKLDGDCAERVSQGV